MILKIGARGSPLSLAQSEQTARLIEKENPGLKIEIITIKTTGDMILDRSLAKIGGKGLFVKEIELALLEKKIDVAIHSAKDMPNQLPDGLIIAVTPKRADHRDVLISKIEGGLKALPKKAIVGTSSLRRAAQLLRVRPDLLIEPIRGNVQTRLAKLKSSFAATVLAAAGLDRLEIKPQGLSYLEPDIMLPAVGQGALALEVRADDEKTLNIISKIHHQDTFLTLKTERSFLKAAEANCQSPIAAWAFHSGVKEITLRALIAEPDGTRFYENELVLGYDELEKGGKRLATDLLKQGGAEIIKRLSNN